MAEWTPRIAAACDAWITGNYGDDNDTGPGRTPLARINGFCRICGKPEHIGADLNCWRCHAWAVKTEQRLRGLLR